MFKLDRYIDFLLENSSSGKMKIYYSDRLREILKDIKFRDPGNIASILLEMENKNEYLDKYTLVDISEDKNDYVTFLQVNRILRGDSSINPNSISLSDDIIDKGSEYLPNYRTEIGIGRWATRIINEIFGKQILPSQTSRLVDFYRSIYDEKYKEDDFFEVIKGKDIIKWYNEENYERKVGQLGNSCMRYDWCSGFFDIYVENPEVCSLLIMYNETKTKIIGRSLLWKTSDGKLYQDRIYANYDSDMFKIKNWATKKGALTFGKYGSVNVLTVDVKPKKYSEYPYMDTFICYNPSLGKLSSDEKKWPGQGFIKIQDTDGNFIDDNVAYSEYHDDLIPLDEVELAIGPNGKDYFYKSEVYYIDDNWYYEKLTTYSKYHDKVVLLKNVVYSEVMDDYLDPNNSEVIKILRDSVGNNYDWTVKDKKSTWVNVDGKYYDSDFYIFDPYSKKMFFKTDKIEGKDFTSYLLDKITKEFNVIQLSDFIPIIRKIYQEKDYNQEYLISEIRNSKRYRENIIGRYWGFAKNDNPTPEQLEVAAFAYVINEFDTSFSKSVLKISDSKSEDLYKRWHQRNHLLTSSIILMCSELDFIKISDVVYKAYLYKVL